MPPANQAAAASAKIERPTAKPRQIGCGAAMRKLRVQVFLAGLQAQHQHAAAMRVVALDHAGDPRPTRHPSRRAAASTNRAGCRLRRSVRSASASVVSSRCMSRGGITSTRNSWPVPTLAHCSSTSRASWASRSADASSRVPAHQALGHMLCGPAAHLEREFAPGLECQRPRAGQLDRPCHPPALAGHGRQHVLAEAAVQDDAGAGRARPAPRRAPSAISCLKRVMRSVRRVRGARRSLRAGRDGRTPG